MDKFMYCWLNLENGTFSNSWTEKEHQTSFTQQLIEGMLRDKPTVKLIKYQCVNDPSFLFTNQMKLK